MELKWAKHDAACGWEAAKVIALARGLIAEYFADLSAQAMTGGLAKLDLAKQNVVVPEVKPIVAAPINVQLQKEMIKKYTSINSWARLLK